MYVCPKCGGTRFTLDDELIIHCENCGEPQGVMVPEEENE